MLIVETLLLNIMSVYSSNENARLSVSAISRPKKTNTKKPYTTHGVQQIEDMRKRGQSVTTIAKKTQQNTGLCKNQNTSLIKNEHS